MDMGGLWFEKQFTIDITDINDKPVVTSSTKYGAQDETIAFRASDFNDQSVYNDEDGDELSCIQIVTLPDSAQGMLFINDTAITEGQIISAGDLNNITFLPSPGFYGNSSFTWKASDGEDFSVSVAVMTLVIKSSACDITIINTPAAANISGDEITARVGNTVTSMTISVDVSYEASWELFSDSECTNEIVNKIMNLSVGTNITYLKVIAPSGASKVYTLTITREAAPYIPPYIPEPTPPELPQDTTSEQEPQEEPQDASAENDTNSELVKKSITDVEGKAVITLTVNNDKVIEKLLKEGKNTIVTIATDDNADIFVGQLNGNTVKAMENNNAVIEFKTLGASYTIKASQINIDAVSQELGSEVELENIIVSVKISKPNEDIIKIIEDTASKNNFKVLVQPVDFGITGSIDNRVLEISKFNGYVERMIAIPDGIDPNRITTGIVLNKDGTFSHVPTTILIIDGKYYTRINSLTNSVYSVIWSPKAFKDVENHWAKEAVNDMASRLIINGTGKNTFNPDRDITRAEFSAIVVRALGLMRPGTGRKIFDDVAENEWYYDAISIAYEYGIIAGYGNNRFGPNDKITYEQAMTMISRAMNITGLKADINTDEVEELLKGFSNWKTASLWARESIAACIKTDVAKEIIELSDNPKDYISRAEVAVIVQKLLQKSGLI